MTWWQQLLVTLGAGIVTAAGAYLAVLATGKHQERLAREARDAEANERARERAEARQQHLRDQRTEAYRAYLRWLAQMPVDTAFYVTQKGEPPDETEVRNRTRESRVVVADLLLHGSEAVKDKAKEVQTAISACSLRVTQDFLSLRKETAARSEPGTKDDLLQFNIIFPKHFYELVWPKAEELAEVMSGELSVMGTATTRETSLDNEASE